MAAPPCRNCINAQAEIKAYQETIRQLNDRVKHLESLNSSFKSVDPKFTELEQKLQVAESEVSSLLA